MKKYLLILLLIVNISAIAQNNLPDPPKFQSASVIPESSPTTVKLSWQPSDSTDVAGYIVYKIVDNITTTLDTVIGRTTTTYEYTGSAANSASERFRMAAFDNDGYKSTITDPHATILMGMQYDKCERKVTISWSQYSGWGQNITNYRIYRRYSESEYQIVATLPATATEYVDQNLTKGRLYYYYVEAVRNDGVTATSNSETITATGHQGPLSLKATSSFVDDNNDIAVYFQIESAGEVVEYQLYKSVSLDSSFVSIASFPNTGQTQIIYKDTAVDATENIYYYKLASIDPCGQVSKISNITCNIVLKVESISKTEHVMEWTDYKEWSDGVDTYKMYSYFDGVPVEIGSNGYGTHIFRNDIANYVKSCHDKQVYLTNAFCYYVEAYENTQEYAQQNVSRSNIACVYETPVVWVPSAFNITSTSEENRVFKPVVSFIKEDSYLFIVYDRWGQQVFKTTDMKEGWSGKDAKRYYHTDSYVYFIKYKDYKDKEYRKSGTFYLLME